MLTVGDKFPSFDLNAVVDIDPAKAFERITGIGFAEYVSDPDVVQR